MIKNFLFKKRVKILRNNKGVSLIEIMVGIGLLSIVAVIAVPQFQAYQREAKYGVLKSMLTVPFRTMEVELSLGKSADQASAGFLWARVKSKAKGSFDSSAMKYETGTGNNPTPWCFYIKGKDDYAGFEGCINHLGTIQIGGDNVPCSQAEASLTDQDSGATTDCSGPGTINCPTGCKNKGGATLTCTDNDTVTVKCEPDTSEVYTKTLTCNSTTGVCSG